jgi:CubicO group peptidase (beta-lactamase class C family)
LRNSPNSSTQNPPQKNSRAARSSAQIWLLAFLFVSPVFVAAFFSNDFALHASVRSPLAQSAVPSSEFQQFAADLDRIRAELRVPGLSAGIVRDGKIIWRQNFGEADAASHAPITDDTLFPIASVSKTMASVIIMQLAGEGRLHLSDPITRFRPDLTLPPSVTIERVISHTAEDVPGSDYLYSGAMFDNLTGVIERIEKKPYAQVLRERIFQPLGMTNTFAGLPANSPASLTARVATGYELDPQTHQPQPVQINLARVTAATGVISNVTDLAKYAIALDSNKLLPADAMQRMTTAEHSTRGATLPYALGWFAEAYLGESLVWHYGQEENYSSLFLRIPARNETLIVLANSSALSDAPRLLDGEVARSPIALAFLADEILASDSRGAIAPSDAISALRTGSATQTPPAATPANQTARQLMRDALISQSRLEFYLGHADQSAALLHQVLDEFPELGLPREPATLFYLTQLNRPDLDKTTHEIESALLELHPTLAPVLYYSGIAESRAGNAEKAEDLWKRACNEWPHTQHWSVGASCLEAGRAYIGSNDKLARFYLGRAIVTNNDDARDEARSLLAKLGDTSQ